MRMLAKNLILTTAIVSAIFFVDYSLVEASDLHHEKFCATEKICSLETDKTSRQYLDFWSKFRDTVMPDAPQNNNPPKEMPKPRVEKPKPANPPRAVNPKPKPKH